MPAGGDRRAQVARVLDLGRKLRRDGTRATAARLALRLHERLSFPGLESHLLAGDVADSTSLVLPGGRAVPPGTPADIGFLCSPAGSGSGGHTTFFRMLQALRERGHRCVVFLYDAFGGDFARHEAAMRRHWPNLGAEFRDATRGITGVDACIASSWETAHALATRGTGPMHRFYFIQDFEPFFYPRGSVYALAADTYRFGFRRIALGQAVAELLKTETGVDADVVPFGCDTRTYRLVDPARPRSGVVFFARPHVPRRGFLLGLLALEEFHRRHPEQQIHVYGDPLPPVSFPVTEHGRLSHDELNELYNRTIGGLALSFTNVTLVAGEMLAAGNIPVANQSAFARGGLSSNQVVWAKATPARLAEALARVVEHRDIAGRAVAAAASVTTTWRDSQTRFVVLVEQQLERDGL